MAKTKDAAKSSKATKGNDNSLKSVKGGNVTKASKTPKSESVAEKVTKAAKQGVEKARQTIKAAVDSDDSDTSASSASSASDSESEEEEKPKAVKAKGKTSGKVEAKANGSAKAVKQQQSESEDEDSDDSDDSDESDAEATKPAKSNGSKPVVQKAATNSDDDDDSEDDSDDSDESDEEETPVSSKAAYAASNAAIAYTNKEASDEDEDSDDSSDDDEEEEEKPQPKKRKAEEAAPATAKKSKVDVADAGISPNLFVGSLSWNVDETMLREHFEQFGALKGVRVMIDRNTGKSKGFGYVEYEDSTSAKKAYENLKDTEIDGRTINLDYAKPNPNNAAGGGRDRAERYGDQLSEPSATIFVGNISFEANEEMISEVFAEHGTVIGVRLPTDQNSGSPKGYGYVEFSSIEEAKTALEALKGYELAGRRLRLDFSTPRAGGGGGGDRGGRGGFSRGGGRGGRGGFGDRGGRGGFGGRGRGNDRGRGRGGFTTNRGGFGDFKGNRQTFD